MTTAYRRGYELERRVAIHLVSVGWVVVAARGSHGIADLVALKAGHSPMLVQVKRDRHTMRVPDWTLLMAQAGKAGAIPVVADCSGARAAVRLWRLTAERPVNGRIDQYLTPMGAG